MPLAIANLATSIPRDNLLSAGTQMGKFTKTGKFRLNLTCLDVVAPHARYKVIESRVRGNWAFADFKQLWIKANGEMPFLYGGNVVKAHVGRWSEDCPEHSGVIVYSQDDTPLGFGGKLLIGPMDSWKYANVRLVSARSTQEAKKLDPTGIVLFRQADVGEYLREVSQPLLNSKAWSAYSTVLTFHRRIPFSLLKDELWATKTLHVRILDQGWELMESFLSRKKSCFAVKYHRSQLFPPHKSFQPRKFP